MKLFGKRAAPPPAPPPVAVKTADQGSQTVSLKLNLPDIFAFKDDETRATNGRPVAGAGGGPNGDPTRGTVLLVESDDEIARLLSRLLQHEGYELRKASCLNEARTLLKETKVDFLLARRASVPRNLQAEIALREVETQCTVRIVDEFSDLMLGQVVDYASLAQCALGLVDLLTSLLEGANTGARGHAHNVAKYCRLVGQRLGLAQCDLDALTLTALVHDLGALETRAGGTTPAAAGGGRQLLPESLQPTLDLLANISFPYNVTDLLAAVSDTPRAESAESAPLGARVLRVVDGYETGRRNQAEFADEDALFEWMRGQPAGLFDADALETLINIRKHERAISAMNIFWAAILIVDPHPDEVQLLKLRLENDDFHVHTAATLEEALRTLRNENITLVLSEHRLANKASGFELLRTLKQDPQLRQTPFVFHAPADNDLVKQALELGAEDWYPKPSHIEIVAMKLQRIIGRLHNQPDRGGAADGVQGSLSEMGIIELIQILSTGGRSLQITLEQGKHTGEFVMHRGQLISATKGAVTGERAALELLRWHEGRFRILALKKPPEPNITASTDSLLLQSCVREDMRYQHTTHNTTES